MPFGKKSDATGRVIDFDAVYRDLIAPGVEAAGLEVIRADEEQMGGTIHKPMYERLMLCEYAIADVTGANPNVYYELGIRHALRPSSTVIIFAENTILPFDIALLRGVPYQLNEKGLPETPAADAENVARRLVAASEQPHDDSPLFSLIADMPRLEVDHSKTDLFREQIDESRATENKIAQAEAEGLESLCALAASMPDFKQVDLGTIVRLFLAFRSVGSNAEMIKIYQRMPPTVQRTRMIQEQYAFALNREGRGAEAEKVLTEIIAENGPSSETYGLLGRIYKDRWDAAKKKNEKLKAKGALRRAIESYLTGFETDWRDAYPGVNAVTLMELEEPPSTRQAEILPIVRYAAAMRTRQEGDYWDYATLAELAVLGRDQEGAEDHLSDAISKIKESFAPETTARNFKLIRETREQRGEPSEWIAELEEALVQAKEELFPSV